MDIRINGAPVQVHDDDINDLLERLEERLARNGVALTDDARDELRSDIGGMLGQIELSAHGRAQVVDEVATEVIGRLPAQFDLTAAARAALVTEVIAALPAPPAPGPVELTEASRHALRDEIIAALPAPAAFPRWVGWLLAAILVVAGAAAFGSLNGNLFGNMGHTAPAPAPIIGGGTVVPPIPSGTAVTPSLTTVPCPNPPGGQCLLVQDATAPGGIRIIPVPPSTPPAPPPPAPATQPIETKADCMARCIAGQSGTIEDARNNCATTVCANLQ